MGKLAERQHGILSRDQARSVGASCDVLRTRLRSGRWVAVSSRVLRLAGAPQTASQRCLAAVLDAGAGAAVSRQTAAALWRLPGFTTDGIHVTRPISSTSRRSPLATVHESRWFPEHHQVLRDAVVVTTVARTLFDLSGCVHPLRAERALDNALARKLLPLQALRATAIELLEHGRGGSALMRQLLGERGAGYIPPASGLEARFFALLVEAGMPLPDRQVDVGGVAWAGRVDFCYRHARLVVEVDSDIHHSAKLDAEADARRDQALRAAGWRVVRVEQREVWDRPQDALEKVRAALATAA